jgi:hypothetical protein
MDDSLFKKMGIHDGRAPNAHLYSMPSNWKARSGEDAAHSDTTCVKHGSSRGIAQDKPNMQYHAKGGKVMGGPGTTLPEMTQKYNEDRKKSKERHGFADGGQVEPASIKVKQRWKFDPDHPFGIKKAGGGAIKFIQNSLKNPKADKKYQKIRDEAKSKGILYGGFHADGGPVGAHSSGMFANTGTYKPKPKPKPRLASKKSRPPVPVFSEDEQNYRTEAAIGGSIFRDSLITPGMTKPFGFKSKRAKAIEARDAKRAKEEAEQNASEHAKGGKVCRSKLAAGAVAKIRKDQY